MIDTIILRIHKLHKYPDIIKCMRKEKEGETMYDLDNPHEKEAIDYETGEINRDRFLQVKQIEYSDTGKTFMLYRNKVLTSSHYYLGYRIRMDFDYIEFNFSIPKYVYGSNLLQFVTHKQENNDNLSQEKLDSMEFNVENTYRKLMKFIQDFKNDWFLEIDISRNDIEIARLDICYNQIFKNKEDAMQYLDYQKRIKKKYLKATSKNKVDWGTSIFLQTERYAAKIYHKGSEYSSGNGERKHHLAMNKQLKTDHFPVDNAYDKKGNLVKEGYQSFADRILRYEVSFKNAFMSHLFKKHLFGKDCEVLAMYKKDYKEVKTYQRKLSELEKIKTNNEELEQKYKALFKEFLKLHPTVKNQSKIYEGLMNKRNQFKLNISPQEALENKALKHCSLDNKGNKTAPKNALFSKTLLDYMFKVFFDFKEQFRLEALDEKFTDTTKRVIAYNQKVKEYNEGLVKGAEKHRKSQINENYINSILLHLQKHSFDELVDLKIISRRTKYNYIKALEKIGLSKNHLAIDSVEIVKSEHFKEYHGQIGLKYDNP